MRLLVAAFALLFAVPAAAQEWWEAETDHFVVKSRSSEAQTRAFALELERYDEALRFLLNVPKTDGEIGRANKVTIFRFGDENDIAHLAGAPGSGIAGFYIPRSGDSVAFAPARESRQSGSIVRRDSRTRLDGKTVLKHEYAHHFMMQYFPGAYPRWYVEGYAETVAPLILFDNGFQVGDPPQHRSSEVLRMRSFPLREMLDSNHELSALDAYQHYSTGWLLSHYLNFDDERRQKLGVFLRALSAGEDSLTAAERVFGDIRALERDLLRYRTATRPATRVELSDYVPPEVTARPLPADETAFVRQKMELWRGVDKRQAERILATIQGRIGAFPQSVEAHLLLAEAAHDAEQYDASIAAATKATELDPRSVRGWLYRGMANAKKAADQPELWPTARQAFIQAANIDPSDPRPSIQYYRTYLAAGETPPEPAVIALESAYDNSGSDSEYRLLLARQLLTEGRFDEARTVVMPVAFQGHATGEADADEGDPTPRRLFDAINRQDAEAAVALIDKGLDPEDEEEKNGG